MIRLRAPIPYQRAATYSAMLRPPSLSDMTSAAAAKSIKSLFSAADQRVIKLVIGAKPRYSLLDSARRAVYVYGYVLGEETPPPQ